MAGIDRPPRQAVGSSPDVSSTHTPSTQLTGTLLRKADYDTLLSLLARRRFLALKTGACLQEQAPFAAALSIEMLPRAAIWISPQLPPTRQTRFPKPDVA